MSAKNYPRHSRRALALAAVLTVSYSNHAHATARSWIGADGAFWSNSSSWSGSVVPVNGDDVTLGNVTATTSNVTALYTSALYSGNGLSSLKINSTSLGGTFTVSQSLATSVMIAATEIVGDTISDNLYTQNGGSNTATSLILGNTATGSGAYSLSGTAVLNVTNFTVGNSGIGTYSQSGGTLNLAGALNVENGTNFTNVVNFSGGNINLPNSSASISIGNGAGAAAFNQSGGTLNAANSVINIASVGSSIANYTLSGGVLNASTVYLGGVSNGTFTQTAGAATFADLDLAFGNSASGTYTLNGASASLAAGYETIGDGNRGLFTQNSGTNTVSTQLSIGENPTATGTYGFNGGTLNIGTGTTYGSLIVGFESTNSTFTQTGGTLNASNGNIILGYADSAAGVFNLKAGSDTADTIYVGYGDFGSGGTGTFNQTGGTLNVTGGSSGGLVVGVGESTGGYYTLSSDNGAAVLNAAYEYIGSGSPGYFTQYAGTTHNVTGVLYIGAGSSGSYEIYGGTLTAATIDSGAGGAGNFTQYGGTVTITSALNINPTLNIYSIPTTGTYLLAAGTLTANAGASVNTYPAGIFAQYPGTTFNGTLTNAGNFTYEGGTFNALLDNAPSGTITLNAVPLLAGRGILNRGTLSITTGNSIGSVTGFTVDNQATLALVGGSLTGPGAIINDATLTGWGTITGTGGFTNNDTLVQGAGTLLLSNTGANTNNASMYLTAGRQLQIATNLTNSGSLALDAALVTGAGTLTNSAAGLVAGPGTVSVTAFSNAGTLLAPAGTTRITPNFTNSGLIQLSDLSASLTGGTISNTGSIQGNGKIASPLNNTGTITPAPGFTLTLAGPLTSTGLLILPATSKLLVTGSFPSNAGTINLQGGTLDTNNQPLSNDNIIAGYGTLSTGGTGLTNNASITLTGGASTLTGPVTNNSLKTIEVRYNSALFTGAVTNNGTIKVTGGATVTFAGSYVGTSPSDPSSISLNPFSASADDGGVTGAGSVLVADSTGVLAASYLRQSSLTTSGAVQIRASAAGGQTSLLNSLTILPTGTLDLADTKMVLDYTGATPLDTIRQYLLSHQLFSSIAAADPQHRLGIGYLEAFLPNLTTWGGQPADSTSILTKMTYIGDANLDGKINADDYALLDRGFTKHLTTWAYGDFNYDGVINAADYLLIDRDFTLQSGTYAPDAALLAQREAQFGDAYVQELLASIPEPSLPLMTSALYFITTNQRRRINRPRYSTPN
ncbi:MAG TPA: dockerin type I domain-containing protein [Tepidisphaeraceae bacterium]|jgi:hypothetical protein|nr:dockerin type I domain-containing protein [Tepidisphaeraceae bacterium]